MAPQWAAHRAHSLGKGVGWGCEIRGASQSVSLLSHCWEGAIGVGWVGGRGCAPAPPPSGVAAGWVDWPGERPGRRARWPQARAAHQSRPSLRFRRRPEGRGEGQGES